MKIALITSLAYPATKAGTEISVLELAKSLLAYGATPVVITHDSLSAKMALSASWMNCINITELP